MKKDLAELLLTRILSIIEEESPEEIKLNQLYKILKYAIDEMIKAEGIHFSTLFSRIAFLGNKLSLTKAQLFHLHLFRKKMESQSLKSINEKDFSSAIQIVSELIIKGSEIKPSLDIQNLINEPLELPSHFDAKKYIRETEILALKLDLDNAIIHGYTTETPHEQVAVRFNVVHKNEIYTNSITALKKMDALPVNINLLDIEVDSEGAYIPSIFVIEPSFLIDVTAVAEAYKQDGSLTRLSLLRRYLPTQQSIPLLLGNLSNHMLDELFSNHKLEFSDIKKQLFQLQPLVFALFDDSKVITLIRDLKVHYQNLKKVIENDFASKNIKHENTFLEPSFYAPSYGLQGRLDLLQIDENENKATIVELKSGRAFRPNIYGLSEKHYVQTLLYDLLVKSAFSNNTRVDNYILYSKESDESLRYAPTVKAKQREAIRIRNEIIIYNKSLERINEKGVVNILDFIKVNKFKKISGFEKADVDRFEKVYSQLDVVEKSYFDHFTAFIAKEQHLSKIGKQDIDYLNGLAGIWQNSIGEKKDNYNILNDLEILNNETNGDVPKLVFKKSPLTMNLSNFRVGDIGVLYPELDRPQSALHTQVFKCTILELNTDTITVRLRSKQRNYSQFKKYKFWHIDHDTLDSGYNKMTQSLFEFASTTSAKRQLWLTREAPGQTASNEYKLPEEMTSEQKQIMGEMLDSQDYYLLWGPPGTGKTSVMVKNFVAYLYNNTDEKLLLLAYTNKAVDEICEALLSIGSEFKNRFIRIGSRYAVADKFVNNLLSNISAEATSRKELRSMLEKHRIYAGTVSSMIGRSELFQLVNFDRVVIDEASQLLEPNIMGFVTRFKKVILIGDHKQLPAVVMQDSKECEVDDENLLDIGLENLSNSLFERLYKRCLSNGWEYAIGQLSQQGRMHEKIMAFPNEHFYKGSLKTIDKLERLHADLALNASANTKQLLGNRVLFVNSTIDKNSLKIKTNDDEAQKVVSLLLLLKELQQENNVKLSIGVITPFRAQIANIQAELEANNFPADDILVDTVERFQGGARDVIIISFCMNHINQLSRMISLSSEGTDRKLNVALTRAKEQLYLIGNEEVLSVDPIYRELLSRSLRIDLD